MGRRHLSRVSALVSKPSGRRAKPAHLLCGVASAASVLIFAAPAGAAVSWRLLADGAALGSNVSTTRAYLALDRAGTSTFSRRLPDAATSKVAHVNFSTDAVVAIFGEFGCQDPLIFVTSVEQHGTTLTVTLLKRRPKPGTVQCMAIYQTYRLLSVAKSSLQHPYPTRATVTLARA